MIRNANESKDNFISRCMSAEADKFPDQKQRYAVCMGYLQDSASSDSVASMTHKFLDRANIGTVRKTSEGYVTARAKSALRLARAV